jgi:hypothetical protein
LFSSSDIITEIKSNKTKYAAHVACIEQVRNAYKSSLKGRNHLEDLGLDGRIILKMILRKLGVNWIHLDHHTV